MYESINICTNIQYKKLESKIIYFRRNNNLTITMKITTPLVCFVTYYLVCAITTLL